MKKCVPHNIIHPAWCIGGWWVVGGSLKSKGRDKRLKIQMKIWAMNCCWFFHWVWWWNLKVANDLHRFFWQISHVWTLKIWSIWVPLNEKANTHLRLVQWMKCLAEIYQLWKWKADVENEGPGLHNNNIYMCVSSLTEPKLIPRNLSSPLHE
jgi:hypothetical protein